MEDIWEDTIYTSRGKIVRFPRIPLVTILLTVKTNTCVELLITF